MFVCVECKLIGGKTLQVMKGEEMIAMINEQILLFCFSLCVCEREREFQEHNENKKVKFMATFP